ncbi:unnamed protein product, partial [Amoebophrya sp. A25]|eukprot:GSA25T00013942001.1
MPHVYSVTDPSTSPEVPWFDTTLAGRHLNAFYGTAESLRASAASDPTGLGANLPSLVSYRRSTRDTPICVLHCEEGSSHPHCSAEKIWGYRVQKCSHCLRDSCPSQQAYFAEDDYRIRTSTTHAAASLGAAGRISNLQELRNFYSYSDDTDFNDCYEGCETHSFFCVNKQDNYDCMKQCISQCLCEDHCEALVEDAANCVEQDGKWLNFAEHFDSFFPAMVTLMELANMQAFGDIMYRGIDARGAYLEPRRDESKASSVYFVLFMFLGGFFLLNLCIGMIIDNFNRVKTESGAGSLFMTQSQRTWVKCQDMLTSH